MLFLSVLPSLHAKAKHYFAQWEENSSGELSVQLLLHLCVDDAQTRQTWLQQMLHRDPLIQWRLWLLDPGAHWAALPITLPPDLVHFIQAHEMPASDINEVIEKLSLPAHPLTLAPELECIADKGRFKALQLVGEPGSGRLNQAQALTTLHHQSLYFLDSEK